MQESHSGPSISEMGGVPRAARLNQNGMHATVMNGPHLSPQGQVNGPLYASNTSPPPGTTSFARAPGYASRDISSSWSTTPAAFSQRLPPASGFPNGKPEEVMKPAIAKAQPEPNPKPHASPSDVAYGSPEHRSYNYQHPYNDRTPSQGKYQAYQNSAMQGNPQTSHQGYQNGHSYPASQASLTHNRSDHQQPPPRIQSGYQTYGSYGQCNGSPVSGWSAPNATPPTTSSHQSPPYPSSHHSQQKPLEYGSAPQRAFNDSSEPSKSSVSRPSSSHSGATAQGPPLSAQPTGNYKNHSPRENRHPTSSTQYPNLTLTPGPPDGPSQTNGYPNNAIPASTIAAQSPVKQASPPTSFTQPTASSPITNQPPLKATNAPTSPGFSPQKHSPLLQSAAFGHDMSAAPPPVLPPAPKLSPSPTQKPSAAPLKYEVPTHDNMPCEKPSAPLLSPSPLPQDLAAPTKHTTLAEG